MALLKDLLPDITTTIPAVVPRMQPVTFAGCFGWLHRTPNGWTRDTAVLLCAGVASDKLSGHRGMVMLADQLAAASFPTLRFDYPDAGDSQDVGEEDRWTLWQDSINAAIDWLRARTGARQVVLIGLRLGATLAAVVSETRDDISVLILLEPVLRGRSFIRQLSVELLVSRVKTPERGGSLDSHDLRLSTETVRRINSVDLSEVRPPHGCKVAIFSQSSKRALSEVVAAWQTAGTSVICEGLAGFEPFLRPTFMSHEGLPETERLLELLRQMAPTKPSVEPSAAPLGYVPLRGDGWVETPMFFGPTKQLFGMMCVPTLEDTRGPAVIIVNASGDPHYGFGRYAVGFARRLAANGIASLRMDCKGIGDALPSTNWKDVATHIIETDRRPDISAAIDVMQARGYRSFALQGLCTGAYHAALTALADRRVTTLLLVNLSMFSWRKGDRVEAIGVYEPAKYLERLSNPATLMRLLQQRGIGINRLVQSLRISLTGLRSFLLHGLGLRTRASTNASIGQRWMETLCRRSVRTLFLYASHDAGIEAFEREFGAGGISLNGVEVRILSDVDHSLSRSGMRRVAIDHMMAYLEETALP